MPRKAGTVSVVTDYVPDDFDWEALRTYFAKRNLPETRRPMYRPEEELAYRQYSAAVSRRYRELKQAQKQAAEAVVVVSRAKLRRN